jgi:hypothetical protein
MAQTKLMGKAKVAVEQDEGPEGASVKVSSEKKPAASGGLQRVEIEVADNGGFLVTLYHKERTNKRGGLGPSYTPPEKHACKTLDDLDEVLDGAFGIED